MAEECILKLYVIGSSAASELAIKNIKEIIAQASIPVLAEVTLLADDTEFEDFGRDRTCLGFCIMYQKISRLGF